MEREESKRNEYEKKIIEMLNTNEINRLHRAAKNKDKKEIIKWAKQYDQIVNERYYEIYKQKYIVWLEETFKDLDTALMYTLHFNEYTKFGNKRLKSVMDDIAVTLKGLYSNEFDRKEYKAMLENDGIRIERIEGKNEEE